MSEILNKYKRWKALLIPNREKELDFVLSQDNANTIDIDGNLTTKCLVSFIDTRLDECIGENGSLSSSNEYKYENGVSDEVKLLDVGFTGIDNGLITYDKNIELKEFVDVLTGSTFEITSGDTRLTLRPVNGNSKYYQYPCEIVNDQSERYYSFKGGFLQGFYKLDGFNYQVLPNNIDDAWNLEFVIRPRTDYTVSGNTLNRTHPENNGIFFYMGTRAENKFARFYGADIDVYPERPNYSGICFDTCTENNKHQNEVMKNREFLFDFYHGEEEEYSCCESPCGCGNNKDELTTDVDTLLSGSTLCVTDIETSNGHVLDNNKYFELFTDNGYLIYDHAEGGHTTKTWKRGDTLHLIQKKMVNRENLYLLMNHAEGGLTTKTLDEYLNNYTGKTAYHYNILNDIKNNAFALKVNSDGSIGYKYFISDCNNESGYSVISESTYPQMVKDNEWTVVNVLIKALDGKIDECGGQTGNRKMRIYLYVNGYLKLVSKDLPMFGFKALNDYYDKQETVPFNISLGGGTQGMAESMWTDNYTRPFCKVLPLEENFGGSFIGDIRSFKFYNCQLQFNEIKNNYIYENIQL